MYDITFTGVVAWRDRVNLCLSTFYHLHVHTDFSRQSVIRATQLSGANGRRIYKYPKYKLITACTQENKIHLK